MSDHPPAVRGVVVAHGSLAEGLTDAVRCIAGGAAEDLHALSNTGKSPEAFREELDRALGTGPAIVFTDLASGSCAHVARLCCLPDAERAIVFGANLPVLLDFVFYRHLPLEELLPRLVERGRSSLQSVQGSALDADPPVPN